MQQTDTREFILKAITEAGEPVQASALTKLPALTHKINAKDLAALLAEDLAAGRVFAWGTKGKPAYWHRDPKSVAHERIMAALADAPEPRTAPALVKQTQAPIKASDVPALLAEDLAAGRVFAWGAKLYWTGDPQIIVRERVLQAIQNAAQPITAAALAKSLKRKSGEIPVLLAEDLAASRVFAWGKLYWHRDAKSLLLDLAGRENLTTDGLIERAAGEAKVDAKMIGAVCKALVKEKQLIGVLKPASVQTLPPATLQENVEEVAEKIFEAMTKIAFAPGTTVTFYRLRQQPELAHIPKKIFDEAALLLQQNRRALLTVHGHATALPPSERDELVTDGLGTYYASIYER